MDISTEVYRLAAYAFYVLVAYSVWGLVQSITTAFQGDLRKIPGPLLSAFTSIPLKLQVFAGRRAIYTHELHERYGPYVRIAPHDVAIADIDAVRAIHRIGSEYHKGYFYQGQSPKQFSDETAGVFGIRNNKTAGPRRKLFLHAGSRQIVTEWEPQMQELASLAVQQIKAELKRNGSCDIMKWFVFMASDVTGSLAFGKPFGNTKHGKSNALINDIEAAMPIVGIRAEFPFLRPIMDSIPAWIPGSITPLFERFDGYAQGALEATRAAQAGNKRKTMFSRMVMDDEKDQMIPDHVVLNEATNVIVAGTDTTALTMTYLVYAVLKHDNVRNRLLKELKTCPPAPKWGDLEKLPYLHNVIYETFRLYPIIPGTLPRLVPVGGEKLGRVVLPAGTQVHTQALTMQRDPTVFKEPLKFDPDRWNNATSDMKEHMLNFGGPSRLCVGQNVARLEIVLATSIFFRECPDVKLAPDTTDESMEFVDFFTAKPKSGKCVITKGDE